MEWSGVDGRKAGVGEIGGDQKGGRRIGNRAAEGWGGRADKIRDPWEGMCQSMGQDIEGRGEDRRPYVSGNTISGTDRTAVWSKC